MATFDVRGLSDLELTIIGVLESVISSILFLIPLICYDYGNAPIPSIYDINLAGLTLIIWFIAQLVNDFILRRYYKINYAWIRACDAIFFLYYTCSAILINFGIPEVKEWLDVGLPLYFPYFLIGFHLIFGFHVIAIYICRKNKKMDKNRNPEEPATPDQVAIQLEEVENANLENPVAMNNEQTCGICLGPKGEVLRTLIPCGHTYFCTECVDRFSKVPDATCPYCREPIASTMRIRI